MVQKNRLAQKQNGSTDPKENLEASFHKPDIPMHGHVKETLEFGRATKNTAYCEAIIQLTTCGILLLSA